MTNIADLQTMTGKLTEAHIIRALPLPLPAEPAMAVQSPKDWPEDFSHENGNYNCICCQCRATFIGHKRRVVCLECATAAPLAIAGETP